MVKSPGITGLAGQQNTTWSTGERSDEWKGYPVLLAEL